MRSLLRNKKGTVIGDFFSGISSSINHFLTSAPKPILIIIFLVFLLFFASIFSFFLNITGHFCDTAGNEYKTGTFNFITNIGLLASMPSPEELDSTTIGAEEELFKSTILECGNYYYNWEYIDADGTRKNLTERYYFATSGRCVDCNQIVKAIPQEGRAFGVDICLDRRAYPKSYDELSWWGRRTCGKFLGACDIPEGYYYDGENNRFVCYEELCLNNETGNPSTQGQLWNLKLKERGATITPPSVHGDRDYRNALRIECDAGDLDPKLRIFGINPFDYRLWVFIIILSALVWLLFKIKRR